MAFSLVNKRVYTEPEEIPEVSVEEELVIFPEPEPAKPIPSALAGIDTKDLADKEKLQAILRKKSLLHFIKASFPNYEAGWVHKELCATLEQFVKDIEDNKSPRLMIFIPPRHGKSMIVSERFPAWALGHKPNWQIVVASYSADLSTTFSKRALGIAKSEFFVKTFPNLLLDPKEQRGDQWATSDGGYYRSVGVGGSLTGTGANILIIDDPVKDWQEANSLTTREKIWDWWTSTAYTRLAPKSGVLVIQTRWHEDDLGGRLEKQMLEDPESDQWTIVKYPAIAEEDEANRKKGEALHPERYPEKKLLGIKSNVGKRVWSALYQQNPRPVGGRYLKRDWFQIIDPKDVPKQLMWVRFWDLAIKAKKHNDHTASCQMAIGRDGKIYVRRMLNFKSEWGGTKERIIARGKEEGGIVGIESVGGFSIAATEIAKSLKGYARIQEVFPNTDKLTRAINWIDKAETGMLYLVDEGDWIEKFLDQAEAFDPAQTKQEDDMVDAVSGCYVLHKELRTPKMYT
jgi:predicted phage terminase large subunit-like protein